MTKRGLRIPLQVRRNETDEDVTIALVNLSSAIAKLINENRSLEPGAYDIDITVTMEKIN